MLVCLRPSSFCRSLKFSSKQPFISLRGMNIFLSQYKKKGPWSREQRNLLVSMLLSLSHWPWDKKGNHQALEITPTITKIHILLKLGPHVTLVTKERHILSCGSIFLFSLSLRLQRLPNLLSRSNQFLQSPGRISSTLFAFIHLYCLEGRDSCLRPILWYLVLLVAFRLILKAL